MARNLRLTALRGALGIRRAAWWLAAAFALLGVLLGWHQFIWVAGSAVQTLAEAAVLMVDVGWLLLLLGAGGLALGLALSGPRGRDPVRRMQLRLTTRSVRWGAAAAGLLVVLLVLVVVVLPPHLAGKDPTAQNDVRTTLLQGLGALLVLTGAGIGAAVTLRQIGVSREQLQATREQMQQTLETTEQQLKLTEQGQLTERFTKAVDQLGSESLAVRLGGIYALQRIARDSEGDRFSISEVLCAYARTAERDQFDGEARRPATLLDRRAADVQAALTILAHWKQRVGTGKYSLDLHGADLQGARLEETDLRYAWLFDAQLQAAHLQRADLQGAKLDRADLQGAKLQGTKLQGASLWQANLQGATADESTGWPDGDWADREYRKKAEGVVEDGRS
jgi:hypothetical protein